MENQRDDEKKIELRTEADPTEPVEEEIEETTESQRSKGVLAMFREALDRARRGQRPDPTRRPQTHALVSDRTARNHDRTKILFVSVAGLVAVLVIFLGVFSSSRSTAKREPAAKRSPSLGQPEDPGRRTGSVTPLLNAETNGEDLSDGQLTAEDINNTARPRSGDERTATGDVTPSRVTGATQRSGMNPGQRLDDVPFTDPALEAYRQRMTDPAGARLPAGATATRPTAAPPQVPPIATAESDALAKSSLIYVRAKAHGGTSTVEGAQRLPATTQVEPTFQDHRVWSGLAAGTRLMARLETAVSTAVKAPAVAVIETHYERDGEMVVPAGTKAFGALESGTQSGVVGIRFHSLLMPGGTKEKIDAGAVGLDFGPLKGRVSGRNRGKQFLARAVTGVGSVAAFAVGHSGGLSGPMDNSILLRERISQNIGMAGEQEVMKLAYSQEIVVTVPGNTRFFLVLQQGAGREETKPELTPAGSGGRGNLALGSNAERPELPTAAELRELVMLKQELNRMVREAAATRTNAPVR